MNISKKWWALIGLSLGGFVSSLDFTIINTALPTIQRDLFLTTLQLQWIMNIFVLAICLLSIIVGRLGDIYGHRFFLYVGMLIFALSCLSAGFAHNALFLIISRAFQGVGIAMIIPCALVIIAETFPVDATHKAIGAWTSIRGLGMAIGPVAGGIIAGAFNWRWIFFINVPITLISFLICWFTLGKPVIKKEKVDWLGFILLSIGLISFIFAIIQAPEWGLRSINIWSFLILSGIAFLLLFFSERKNSEPLLLVNLFMNSTFLCSAVINFTILFFAYTVFFLAPLYLENVHDLAPQIVGFILLPVAVFMILASIFAGILTRYIQVKHLILFSLVLFAVSALLQMSFNPFSSFLLIEFVLVIMAIALGIMGIAWGTANVFSISAAVSCLPKSYVGIASGTLSTIRNIGGTIGLAIAISAFRYRDHIALNELLLKTHIHLSESQKHIIRSHLSDPNQAQAILAQFSHSPSILSFFKIAFMEGYTAAMKILLLLSVVVFIFTFYMMKRKKAYAND